MKKLIEKAKRKGFIKFEILVMNLLLFIASNDIVSRCAFPFLRSEVEMPEEYIEILEK